MRMETWAALGMEGHREGERRDCSEPGRSVCVRVYVGGGSQLCYDQLWQVCPDLSVRGPPGSQVIEGPLLLVPRGLSLFFFPRRPQRLSFSLCVSLFPSPFCASPRVLLVLFPHLYFGCSLCLVLCLIQSPLFYFLCLNILLVSFFIAISLLPFWF